MTFLTAASSHDPRLFNKSDFKRQQKREKSQIKIFYAKLFKSIHIREIAN